MSHIATTWALKIRGLKPSVKLVLFHLADRHNPDNGCFPSQERLADDCEISRATLNRHLDELEGKGLIKRVRRLDPSTNRQKSTLYILGFEMEGKAEKSRVSKCDMDQKAVSQNETDPCLKNGESRVSNRDTNLVIEPVREPVMAASPAGDPPDDLDKILYQRGKGLLGNSSGGQITKLKNQFGVGRALELIDIASKKENSHEYIAGIIAQHRPDNSGAANTIHRSAQLADAILAEREETGINF